MKEEVKKEVMVSFSQLQRCVQQAVNDLVRQ